MLVLPAENNKGEYDFMVQSSLLPIPFNYLLIYVVISVIALIISYIRTRQLYKLSLMAGVIVLFALYWVENKTIFYIFGGVEFILLIITIVGMKKASMAQKHKSNSEKAE